MENLICRCLKCGSELGNFRNTWMGIGNSYYSPLYAPIVHQDGFVGTGEVFAKGPDGSAVQNSVLQDLACKECATVVGLRCKDAPDGHLLKKNQLILRLAELNVVSEQTGEKATIVVQERIALLPAGAKKPPPVRRAATAQPSFRGQRSGSLIETVQQKLTNDDMPPPSAVTSSGKNLAKFATWAENAINDQQKDIDRIGGAVARIEKDVRSFKEIMAEVRAELAATRATRKTQDDLKQEQLVWLQEDLKELRQEHEDFQQDIREQDLPSIRNELDQLRQEVDSNDRLMELPGSRSLPPADQLKDLKNSVMRIDHKFSEVEGLKTQLQRLQKQLADMENKRQEAFVFPRMLPGSERHDPTPNNNKQNGFTSITQQPQLISKAADDVSARSVVARMISPSPPGAFPHSIVDLDASHQDMTPEPDIIQRNSEPGNVLEVAETASPKATSIQKWKYAGPRRWQGVKDAFQGFGLEYPKLGVSESIRLLEDHVNNSNLQVSEQAKHHSRIISREESIDVIGFQDTSVNAPESSRLKRKHIQVDAVAGQLLETTIKRRKRFVQSTKEDQAIALSRSLRPQTTNQNMGAVTSSDHGSPELGRDSVLRSITENAKVTSYPDPSPGHLPGSGLPSTERFSGRVRNTGGAGIRNTPRTYPLLHITANSERIQSEIFDELAGGAENAPMVAAQEIHKLIPSIEADDTHIPGSFPTDIYTPAAKVSDLRSRTMQETPLTTPYKCGGCGKRYARPGGLKYHKSHSSCNEHPGDEIPKFKCPSCSKELTLSGMQYHLQISAKCRDAKVAKEEMIEIETNKVPQANKAAVGNRKSVQGASAIQPAAAKEAQERREILAARERLVRATLERA